MQVVNFDLSQERPIEKVLMVALPAALTETICYPALRLQALILGRQWQTNSAFRELQYHSKVMDLKQLYQGLRYAIDHSVTYITARYLLFEWFVSFKQDISKWWVHTCVLGSTALATVIGHPSFLYRTMAASDQSVHLRAEDLRAKLKKINQAGLFRVGLKESLAINCLSAFLDVELFFRLRDYFEVKNDFGDILPAFLAVLPSTILLHPLHRYRHILIQNHFEHVSIKPSLNFDGVLTSLLRRSFANTILFTLYTTILHYRIKYQIEGMYSKRQIHDSVRTTQ